MSFNFGPDVVLDRPAYVDPTARIFGRVSAGDGCSFWPYSVIRAESNAVRIGRACNIQDGAVIHVGARGTTIGDYCSIAHRAVVHGAEIGDDCLIGIGAVVMDGAKIGRRCMVGAMALVPPGMEVPEGSVVTGVPGKIAAPRDNFPVTRRNALIYHRNALAYAQGRHDGWRGEAFAAWRADVLRRLQAGEEVEHPTRGGTGSRLKAKAPAVLAPPSPPLRSPAIASMSGVTAGCQTHGADLAGGHGKR